jgi:hypothetical protein
MSLSFFQNTTFEFITSFFCSFDTINRGDDASKNHTSDKRIHFLHAPLCEGSFSRTSKHYDSNLLILMVLEGKLSFGTETERRLFSMVACTLLKARFSGRMILRENGPKKHSVTNMRFDSEYTDGRTRSPEIVRIFRVTDISISDISIPARGAIIVIASSPSRISRAT